MDFQAIEERLKQVGPHPGLSGWHAHTVLLYRCNDIDRSEFKRRLTTLADKLEKLLEQALPENLEVETYQVAARYYDDVAQCLSSYLDGLDRTLDWLDTLDEKDLEISRHDFIRADYEWNITLNTALATEREFQETDQALIQSFSHRPAGT